MQANLRNRSTANVIGYSSSRDNSSGCSFSWKTEQTSGAASYSKFASRKMGEAEALLKGLKKTDQQSILDDFHKRGSGIAQPSVAPSVAPTPLSAPAITSTALAGIIASREDVLTKAAALARGAATTGFKRFLALTEAAKDRNDGRFKRLFNA